ncbi:cation channel sperm-associated protein 2 isoform X6 [Meriones unguiculatus]|uniref:cation channel sperm-associated protein 2 isoform X6 n=1 Tax=Meriones unguiculatus TaxID=10047 RepID=UPI00293F3A65|nr:cation channel sperm-associated protein 2 isoform X6 [Meriones unguiculatus]
MTEEEGHLQLPRADAIRSRLIDTFSLIEHLQGLSQAVPRHTVREILDPSRQKKLMSGDQHQLVRFSIKPRHMGITHSQRMLSRLHVRCSQRPPLSLWAGWVLESPIFSNFIISLIFLNTIVLMVETDYSRSTIEDLQYNMFFSDLLNSLVTVFILFTLDHWYAVLQDVWKVPEASRVFSSIYVILWLLLGSIIFRNIIVAMMVTNFQNIRNELSEEMTHLEVQYKADIFKRRIIQRRQNLSPELAREISKEKPSKQLSEAFRESIIIDTEKSDTEKSEVEKSDEEGSDTEKKDTDKSDSEKSDSEKSDSDKSDSDKSDSDKSDSEEDETKKSQKDSSKGKIFSSSSSSTPLPSISSSSADHKYIEKLDWETLVHENLPGLMDMDQDDRVVWPRDSLFRYFELLEKLQYNLEERKKLQEFAVQALMNFEDK